MFKITKKISLLLATLSGIIILNGCLLPQQQLQHQADSGNRSAQAMLAEAYLRGYFATVNYAMAKRWAQLGAIDNQALALFVMGEIYRNGYGKTNPNYKLAIDYYQRALPQLRQLAVAENIHAAYDLGLLYKYGIMVEQDYTKALYYFRRGIYHDYPPAIDQLGIAYRDGLGVDKNPSRAKHYLLQAANDNYPPAQYNLAMLYLKQRNMPPAVQWLNSAATAEYPPAMTRLADWQQHGLIKPTNPKNIVSLYRHAALMGYSEAQFALAKLLNGKNELPEAVKWLLQAVERSYSPAMLKLAELNAAKQPVKALILLELAKNSGSKVPRKLAAELDNRTGMGLIVQSIWNGVDNGELYLKTDSAMQRIIRGYNAGIARGSHDLFLKALRQSPEKFYLSCDWQLIIQHHLPTEWTGEIFQYAPKTLRNYPAFWLAYGTCANYAGRGAIAMYAAQRLTILTEKLKPSPQKKMLRELAMLIKCTALVILGHDNDAYNLLFSYGKLTNVAPLTAYINYWALPALKDPKKFIAATGLNNSLAIFSKLPAPTTFYDIQANSSAIPHPAITEPKINIKQ